MKKATAALVAWLVLFGSCDGDEVRVSLPTMQDAMAMIAADRAAFAAVAAPDDEDVAAPERRPPNRHNAATGTPDESDPALDDFAAYAVLIESDPDARDNVELHVSRAELFIERGFPDRAIQDVLMALRLDIDSQAAWHMLGRAHEMQGELEMAQAAYESAIDLGVETEAGIAAQWDQAVLELIAEDDRRETVTALGMPDAFTLIMIAPAPDAGELARYETWFYYRAGVVFEFVNGKVTAAEDMEDIDPETVAAIFPPYRPHQFLPDLDFEAVADIIGEPDYALFELGDDPLQDGELVYTRQLALGFKNGGLFYVRAFPLFTDEQTESK